MRLKYSKSNELWHRIIVRKKVRELVEKFRTEWNIPKYGFDDEEKTKKFMLENRGKFWKPLNEYIKQCREDISFPNDAQFQYEMIWHFINGHADGEGLNFTGCDLDLSNYNKDGTIAIKIGVNSTAEDVKDFINSKKGFIVALQKDYRKKHNLKTSKIRSSNNRSRDALIYYFAQRPINELYQAVLNKDPDYVRPGYKEAIIKKLLEEFRLKINDTEIKMIISRQRKLRDK